MLFINDKISSYLGVGRLNKKKSNEISNHVHRKTWPKHFLKIRVRTLCLKFVHGFRKEIDPFIAYQKVLSCKIQEKPMQ